MSSSFNLGHLRDSVERLLNQLKWGCGNHGCRINPPKGVGTNAICRCYPRDISRTLFNLSLLTEKIGDGWEDVSWHENTHP